MPLPTGEVMKFSERDDIAHGALCEMLSLNAQ
jgi:hypothetical protein